MTFPSVVSETSTVFDAGDTTSHAVNMPATVAAGDLLFGIICNAGSGTVTTPSGWTLLGNQLVNGVTPARGSIYAKNAAGSEGGTTVDFITSVACKMCAQIYRIQSWGSSGQLTDDVVFAYTIDVGGSNNPDAPPLGPSWNSGDTLWFASATGANVLGGTPPTYPAYYLNGVYDNTPTSATGNRCFIETASRNLNAPSDDPGSFSNPSASQPNVAWTIAVGPVTSAAQGWRETDDSVLPEQGFVSARPEGIWV